jgi:hypothetical protein
MNMVRENYSRCKLLLDTNRYCIPLLKQYNKYPADAGRATPTGKGRHYNSQF